MKWAYPRKSTEEHHSVGNMWMQMSKKKSSFCHMMDGKDVLQLPLYPPSHGTFRPFQMYCLVFGLLLVSRLLQYFKPQKFDTYSHVKQMFVPIFPMNGESREQMVLSKTPIKNNVWKRPSTWSIFWMRMWVSVTNFANKKIFEYVGR